MKLIDLEQAGITMIQVDEPAIREGLPLRRCEWKAYLRWAVDAFKLATSGVQDETQIHTHMCYSEFGDMLGEIAEMDADVMSIRHRGQKWNCFSTSPGFIIPTTSAKECTIFIPRVCRHNRKWRNS